MREVTLVGTASVRCWQKNVCCLARRRARASRVLTELRFCTAFDELRHYLRLGRGEQVSSSDRRQVFRSRWSVLMTDLAA